MDHIGPAGADGPAPGDGHGPTTPDLADLLRRAGRGDEGAFARLYDETAARAYGLALRVVRDPAQAEEVTQEAFLEIWRTASRYDPGRGGPLAWLLMITHRTAVDRVRSADAATRRDTTYHLRNQAVDHDATAEAAQASLEARRVRSAMAALTDVQREAVGLAYLGGYTHTEVATMLDLPVGTAKTRIRDGLIRLRDTLGGGIVTEIHALSGAYAVDALDDLERAAFERHLTQCAECRAEVASLREAAGLLAETTATEPPPALRDRVLAGISTVRPLPPEVPAPARPHQRPRLRLLAAAAAAVVLVGAGAVAWQQPWEDETSQQQPPTAQAVLNAADARSTSLDFPGGASATVTHSDSLARAVIVTEQMPAPPHGKVYQLWLDQPGEGMVSAGVMPVKSDQTVLLNGDAATATAAGITVEPTGGSTAPTTEPIALFDFGRSGG